MLRIAIPYGTLIVAPAAQARARSRASTTRATATSPPGRTCSSTGSSWRTRPTPGHAGRGRDARHPDQRQLHPQRHRRPLRRRRGRRDRGPARLVPRSCASGRRCIPSSASCRASSRSPSPARPTTAPPCACTTSACACGSNEQGEVGFEVIVGGGLGRTPMIGKTIREFLPKDELLGLPRGASCASTTATAGATTSTRRASRSWCTRSAPRRCAREVEAEYAAMKDSALKLSPETVEPIARQFAPPALRPKPDPRARGRGAEAREPRLRAVAQVQRRAAQACRLRHRRPRR